MQTELPKTDKVQMVSVTLPLIAVAHIAVILNREADRWDDELEHIDPVREKQGYAMVRVWRDEAQALARLLAVVYQEAKGK